MDSKEIIASLWDIAGQLMQAADRADSGPLLTSDKAEGYQAGIKYAVQQIVKLARAAAE